jgi:hypothetical protein
MAGHLGTQMKQGSILDQPESASQLCTPALANDKDVMATFEEIQCATQHVPSATCHASGSR